MDELRRLAEPSAARRLWLVTTNENRRAIAFYGAWGMRLCARHRGALPAARAR